MNEIALPVRLSVEGQRGYLFESEVGGVAVFVPDRCIQGESEGEFVIDQTGYFLSGWADKNARFSDVGTDFERVFPDREKPITDQDDPAVGKLISRLEHAYEVSLGL